MKRTSFFLTAFFSFLILSVYPLSAGGGGRHHFIAKGGFNYSGISGPGDIKNLDPGEYSGFNIGGAIKVDLPLAFSIQPEILYFRAGSRMKNVDIGGCSVDGHLYNDNIYVPVNVQWGPKLGLFRIYAQISPFFGFTLSNRLKFTDPVTGTKTIQVLTDDTNIFMGGIGAGIGVEVWKIQVSAKYNWNLNKLFKDIDSYVQLQDARMRGLEISVGFIF